MPTLATRKAAVGAVLAAGLALSGLSPLPSASAQVGGGLSPRMTTPNQRLGDNPSAVRGADVIGFAVNPTNPDNVVATYISTLETDCIYQASFDGGRTWAGGALRNPPGFPQPGATLPQFACNPGSAMDTGIAWGSGQNVYIAWSANRTDQAGGSLVVARSTNGGRSFEPGVLAAEGGASGAPNYTRPEIGVHRGAGAGGSDRLYMAVQAGGQPPIPPATTASTRALVFVSNDSGATWSGPRDASGGGGSITEQSGPVVTPDGAVHVFWRTSGNFEGFVQAAKSTDQGQTWTVTNAAAVRGYRDEIGSTFTGSTFPRPAVDARNGTLYIVYMQGPPTSGRLDHFIHPDVDAVLVRSTDGGATWSAPVRVNDDPLGSGAPAVGPAQRHPKASVAPNGRVDVVWQDRRHGYRSPTHSHLGNGEARMGDTYWSWSTDGGRTFSPNRRVSDRTQNLDIGNDHAQGEYWNWGPDLVPLGDDRVLLGWMDSREGNINGESFDIYTSIMDVDAGPGPIPVRRVEAADTASLSVRLSQLGYQGGAEAVLNTGFTVRPITRLVIVNSADPAAAMVGSVLARAHLASVIAAPGGALTAEQRAEVLRMDPVGAFLLGGEEELGRSIVADLRTAGVPADQITRVAPSTVAELASIVALSLDRRLDTQRAAGQPAFDAVVVANPASSEAAGAAGLAASARLPYLFTDGAGNLPAVTTDALRALNITTTLVAGNASAVADSVLASLPGARRLIGEGAAAVSLSALGEAVARRLPTNMVYVADSARPVDAGLLAAAVARAGGLQLLTPGADPAAAEAALSAAGIRNGVDFVVTAVSGALGGPGYRLVAQDGGIFAFGSRFLGSLGATRLNRPVVASAATRSGGGYYLVASDGGVFTFGDATFAGSTGAIRLASPIVAMAPTASGRGYWLAAADGGVFAFGDAGFFGSTGGRRLAAPTVSPMPRPTGRGYLLVASDGGVFAFGDATFAGSTGAIRLASPIVGAAGTPSGRGYLLVAGDGGVFAFGDATFAGSTGGRRLARPIVGVAPTASGKGYWLAASDGGVFAFGDAVFRGSTGALRLASPVVGISAG
jgi:hypothetical protein